LLLKINKKSIDTCFSAIFNGKGITKMHYVGHFIVWMMGQMLFGVSLQIMRCIFCCSNYIFALNSSTKERKGIIKYYKTYGITILKKHVDANHFINSKKIKEEVNNVRSVEKQLAKKKPNVSIHVISSFIVIFSKKWCVIKKYSIWPWILIVKNHMPF